jgi:thymidylate kinase
MKINSEIRRICFFGGPSTGKSETAARVYAELKSLGLSVELVSEYIKTWVYEGRTPWSTDQIYSFAKQMRSEDVFLRGGADLIVTDSPLFLNCAYATDHRKFGWEQQLELAIQFEESYPSLNFFLKRDPDVSYQEIGRYHDREEAVKMDETIMNFLEDHHVPFYIVTDASKVTDVIEYRITHK